jgi:hypothetical protein
MGALGGVAVGSGAEILRSRWTFQREKKWAAWDEQKHQLEMVYEALEQVRESYGFGVGNAVFAIRTGKQGQSISDAPKVPWARLRMLVHLYCPWLLSDLLRVESTGPVLGSAMARAIMEQTGNPQKDEPNIDTVMTALRSLNEAIDQMRESIVHGSRELESKSAVLLGDKSHR